MNGMTFLFLKFFPLFSGRKRLAVVEIASGPERRMTPMAADPAAVESAQWSLRLT